MIAVLAENDFGDNIGDGLAGPVGLLIIVLLVIATVLLMRNMNARLRRLPERFPNHPDGPAARARREAAATGDDPADTPAGGGTATLDADAVLDSRSDPGTAGHS
jgi:hypothetical protein